MNKTEDTKKVFLTGKVVSAATPKTVIVEVVHQFRHPLYKKAVNRMTRFAVHNENTVLAVGDTVNIAQTKPVSRTKHFIVIAKV